MQGKYPKLKIKKNLYFSIKKRRNLVKLAAFYSFLCFLILNQIVQVIQGQKNMFYV